IGAHNTIQFDDREPMPRLGRFLWGEWLRTEWVRGVEERGGGASASASYRDYRGARHERQVQLAEAELQVTDRVGGFTRRAVLRWRLRPGDWTLAGDEVTDGRHRLRVTADVPVVRVELVSGWESRYYLHRSEIPVLEVEVASPSTIVTSYRWQE
ncbi:MAG TPA: heparinase II/III family protein, partial [Longimicrobiaceae bacterium]|nr:heparinase II/III family protein [Longimicrobiaceae bacterium]